MLGREEEAQAAYVEAADVAHGVAPGSYAKALASLKHFDDGQIEAMEEAVRFLKHNVGAPLSITSPLNHIKKSPVAAAHRQGSS